MNIIKEVTPNEVEKLIKESHEVILIDVREDEEVAEGIIPGAMHIPLNSIPQATTHLDKSKQYILICRSGKRSMNAALYMNEDGFDVSNMNGGMLAWHGETIKE